MPGAGHPQVGSGGLRLGGTGVLPGFPGHGAVISPGRPRLGLPLAQAEHAPSTEQGLIKSF